MSLFGAAFAAPNKGTVILYLFMSQGNRVESYSQKIVKFQYFSRP